MKQLHIVNGDATRVLLERSGVSGTIAVQADPLLEGPCPPVDEAAWWDVRARHLAAEGYAPFADIRDGLRRWDEALETAPGHEEVVLWFEHDLYDQLLLVRLLAYFHERPHPSLSLVCIGEHPAVPAFKGLGELTPEHLASLHDVRSPVSGEMLALGRAAWNAYRDPDPRALETLLQGDLAALRFLERALRRHLEEYPAIGDGLTRTERNILRFVADGITDPMKLWQALHRMEDCHYVADSWLLRILRGLMAPPAPLLVAQAPIDLHDGFTNPLSLTPLAHQVLAGRGDWLALVELDRWLGGVHLDDRHVWRWDPARQCLLRC
jgi:hypothetical protein